MLQKMKPSQFKINYQYREYHLKSIQIQHAAPAKPTNDIVDIFKIRKPDNLMGLVLAFYISFALSARKISLIIQWVFGEKVSYQTLMCSQLCKGSGSLCPSLQFKKQRGYRQHIGR
jgi:hypothetical protein